jgi:hypothetical protein
MTALTLILALLAGRLELSTAAVYATPGDRFDDGRIACQGLTNEQVRMGLAHRERPCGSPVIVCGRRCALGFVVDRGPVGVIDGHGRWHARPRGPRPGERYRGSLDLRPDLARAAGVRGVQAVAVLWLDGGKK